MQKRHTTQLQSIHERLTKVEKELTVLHERAQNSEQKEQESKQDTMITENANTVAVIMKKLQDKQMKNKTRRKTGENLNKHGNHHTSLNDHRDSTIRHASTLRH